MASPGFARNGGFRSGRRGMDGSGFGSSQTSDVTASALGGGAGGGAGGIGQSNYAEEKGERRAFRTNSRRQVSIYL
jgi:hypothetical protein